MASPWEDILASPEFSAMTPEEKQTTRDVFFDEVIAPQEKDPEVLGYARELFNQQNDFMPKVPVAQDPGAMGAFLKSAKHEIGSGLGGGIGGAIGAAIPAAIYGSSVGPLGTLAGAVGGALIGGFGGQKIQEAVQGKEAYEKEAQELAKLSEAHPIAASTGALLPAIPTMALAPGAGAVSKIAGLGDEISNVAAQAIRRTDPNLTTDAVEGAAKLFRLMKPADAVKYAQSLNLGDDAVQAIEKAAVSTGQRLAGQALESGAQMGIMSAGTSAAQIAAGNKDISELPGDVLRGTLTGAPLGLMGPVALGKGRLGAALGGTLVKGPVDAALMATGEEAYDAATGRSEGFSFQRAGERAVGMLPSFSLLAGGMGVFHGKPEFKKPTGPTREEMAAAREAEQMEKLPSQAEAFSVQENEAIQKYLDARKTGNEEQIAAAKAEMDAARDAANKPKIRDILNSDLPPEEKNAKIAEARIRIREEISKQFQDQGPTVLQQAAEQAKDVSSPELINAVLEADANVQKLKAEEVDRQVNQLETDEVIAAEKEKAIQSEQQFQKLKEQKDAIQERSAEEMGEQPLGPQGIRGEGSPGVEPIEQRIETSPAKDGELRPEEVTPEVIEPTGGIPPDPFAETPPPEAKEPVEPAIQPEVKAEEAAAPEPAQPSPLVEKLNAEVQRAKALEPTKANRAYAEMIGSEQVRNAVEKFSKSGDKADLAGLKEGTQKRIIEWAAESGMDQFKAEAEKNAEERTSRAEVKSVKSIRLSATGEPIPSEEPPSSDLIAARGKLEEAQKAFDEAHQPIPITEATPEYIDSVLARREQTAKELEAAKGKLKYEAIKDATKNLPWEQRSKEMEGIADVDTLNEHKDAIKEAVANRRPVNAEAAKEYGIKLDSDYETDAFGVARPTLNKRIRPFKQYAERGSATSEKVSAEQVKEAIKLLPKEVRKILEKSGFNVVSREEALKLRGITQQFAERAEGFFYDGKIYLIPENIKVTTKDGNALRAAARVLIHENLHDAFNAVVAKDPKAMEEWKGLLKQIPENDLEALARTYEMGPDWRRHPDKVMNLAEEWLAKKWEDYQGNKMVEAERPIFERILESVRKIIDRVFGGISQYKAEDQDLEAFFESLIKNRAKLKGAAEGEIKASMPTPEEAESRRMPVTPEMNAKYMDAVKNGDMEAAQKMVDEAAKRAGFTYGPFFRGDKVGDFNVFDPKMKGSSGRYLSSTLGFFFTPVERFAKAYAGPGGDVRRFFLSAINPMEVELSAQNQTKEQIAKIQEDAKKFGSNAFISLSKNGDILEMAVESPSQIKSADPITYDNNGNPIPLTERFNQESPDIRFSMPTPEGVEERRQFGKDLFGISMARLREQAKNLDLDPLERRMLKTPDEVFELVRKQMQTDTEMGKRAIARVESGEGGPPSQEEIAAMAIESKRLANQLVSLDSTLDTPGLTMEEYSNTLNQIERVKGELFRASDILYSSATAQSRAFAMRQKVFSNEYELQNIYRKARRAKGGAELTKQERDQIFTQADKILKDTDAWERLQSEKDKLKIPDLINLIAKQVDEMRAKGQMVGDEGAAVKRETPPTPGLKGFDLAYESLNDFMKARVTDLDSQFERINRMAAELKRRGLKRAEGIKASFAAAEDEFAHLSDAEMLRLFEEAQSKFQKDSATIAKAMGVDTKSKEPKTILDEAKAKIAQLQAEPKAKREKTPLQKLLDEHRELRMGVDEFAEKAEKIGLERDTATELYRAFNVKNGERVQELPDSVYGRLLRKFIEEGDRDVNVLAERISKWLGDNGYGEISPSEVMERVSGYGKKIFPSQEEIQKNINEIRAQMRNKLKADELPDKTPEEQYSEAKDSLIDELEKRRAEISSKPEVNVKAFAELGDVINFIKDTTPDKWNKSVEAKLRKVLRNANDTEKELLQQMLDTVDPELALDAKERAIQTSLNNRLKALEQIRDTAQENRQKADVEYPPYFKDILAAIEDVKKSKEKGVREKQLNKALKNADDAIAAHEQGLPPEVKPKRFESIDEQFFKEKKKMLKEKRYTRLLQSQERKWEKKLAERDFAPKKKEERALDEKQKDIKARIDKTKEEIEKTIKDLEFQQLSPAEKVGEWLVRWKRYAILSSPVSVFKLSTAAMTRAGTMSMENFMPTPLDLLYPEYAKLGILESRGTAKQLADALAKGWTKGLKDAADTLKKGQSEIDKLYGKGAMDKEGWTNFFGRMHGMLKAPVKRAAFELAMSKQIRAFEIELKRQPDLNEQLPMAFRAYEWANRQIFMNDNAITSAWNSGLNTLEQKGWKGAANLARFMLPIVKVPTNIALETMAYTPGGIAKASYDMFKVVKGGLDAIKDKPEVVEAIQRNFRKGFIGTGLMLLGYALPQIAGGFYERGEKRHEDEPDFGEMMIGGVRIPKWALHAPFFEVIQLGSTFRRAVDESLKKHGERDYTEGAIAGLKGVVDELPFIAEMGRVSDAFDNQKSRNRFLADMVASSAIPAAVGYVARKTDVEAPPEAGLLEKLNAPTVKRETAGETLGQTIGKSVQAQIPVLREQLLPRVDNPFGPGAKVSKQIQQYEKAGHPMPSVSTRADFEKGYGKVSDARWLTYVSNRGRAIRQAMNEKIPELMGMSEEDKRRAIQQITKHASSEARKTIGLRV